jgi:hypothetical protein
MKDQKEQELQGQENTRHWVIYGGQGETPRIQKAVDTIFSEYSFYPEIDWKKYGYLPPEDRQVMGAWRHPQTKAFAFLLDNPKIKSLGKIPQFLISAAGEIAELSKIDTKISALKQNLSIEERKEKQIIRDKERLGEISKKPFGVLFWVIGIFTAVINGFSLYLRKIPLPEFRSDYLSVIYIHIFALVHYLALILLLAVIIICLSLLIKYGVLYVRRL